MMEATSPGESVVGRRLCRRTEIAREVLRSPLVMGSHDIMRTSLTRIVFAIALLSSAAVVEAAEKYKESDLLTPFTTKDQHENSYTFEPGVRLILVSFEMGSGKAANAFFEKQPADFLAKNQALFIANIYGMPGIGRMFALPKMKKYPHRILLADAEEFLARYPEKEDMLTVLRLDDKGVVRSVDFVDPKKGLPAVFKSVK